MAIILTYLDSLYDELPMRDKIISIENLMTIILTYLDSLYDEEFDDDHSDISRISIKSYARKTRFDAFCTVYGNGCTECCSETPYIQSYDPKLRLTHLHL
uniref:DUF2695 domain-containing protein n=1 Tax=Heterorhabditis bacteriophora TaxID=37862 RepID=A0A1I7WDE4_HETBA